MAYVDINPVKAGIVSDIAFYQHASGSQRAKAATNHPENLANVIAPLASRLITDSPAFGISVGEYLNIANDGVRDCIVAKSKDKNSRWFESFDNSSGATRLNRA